MQRFYSKMDKAIGHFIKNILYTKEDKSETSGYDEVNSVYRTEGSDNKN